MLSRIANSLYWMSRYLERVDNTARIIDINRLHMLEAEDSLSEGAQWSPLLKIVGAEELYPQVHGSTPITARRVCQLMLEERSNPGSLYMSLRLARENARVVRDRISRPMWETINELWLYVDGRLRVGIAPDRADDLLQLVRKEVARFHGVTVNSMMRGEAFGYHLLGTFLERADMTARILDVKYHLLLPDTTMVGSALDYYQWAALLKSLSGFEAYRRRHQSELRPLTIAGFVITEPEFPRSLRFCVARMAQARAQVGAKGPTSPSGKATQALEAALDDATAQEIFHGGLHEFLDDFLARIAALNDALQVDYFESHLDTTDALHDRTRDTTPLHAAGQ
jgi:uncharacterized alpha-E superfamily protein